MKKKNQNDPLPLVDSRNKKSPLFLVCSREILMIKVAMEEVAALMSLTLFVSMIAIWAQVIAVL